MNTLYRFILCVLLFIVPLFFLADSFEVFDLPKIYLAGTAISLLAIYLSIDKIFIRKKYVFEPNTADFLILTFYLFSLASFFWAPNKHDAFWGSFSYGVNGLWFLSFGVLAYWLFRQFDSTQKEIYWFFSAISLSLASALLVGYGAWLGWFSNFNFFGEIVRLSGAQFNTVGRTQQYLAYFLSSLLPALIYWIVDIGRYNVKKIVLPLILSVLSVIFMAQVADKLAWVVLLIGLILATLYAFKKNIFVDEKRVFILPFVLILLCFLMMTPGTKSLLDFSGSKQFVFEERLSASDSLKLAMSQINKSPLSGLAGVGIGNFNLAFTKFKPQEFLNTDLAPARPYKAFSLFFEIFFTTGLIGFLLLVGLVLTTGYFLLTNEDREEGSLILFALFVGSCLVQALWMRNAVLDIYFWSILSLSVARAFPKEISFLPSKKTFHIIGLACILLLSITNLIIISRVYSADKDFLKAIKEKDFTSKEKYLLQAIANNPWEGFYDRTLAQTRWASFSQYIAQNDVKNNPGEFLLQLNRVSETINSAINKDPNSLSAIELKAAYLRELRSWVDNGKDMSVELFKKALELDPMNPQLYVEIAKIYLADNQLPMALEQIEKSLSLQNNYPEALIYKAIILEKENKVSEAILLLEGSAKQIKSPSPDLLFHLGRLYLGQEKYILAKEVLALADKMNPNNINIIYLLGNAFEKSQEESTALQYYLKAQSLDPNNNQINQKIEKMRQPKEENKK